MYTDWVRHACRNWIAYSNNLISVRVFIFYRLVDAIVVNNGTFSWGTTDDDIEVLKKYVNLYFHVVLNALQTRALR